MKDEVQKTGSDKQLRPNLHAEIRRATDLYNYYYSTPHFKPEIRSQTVRIWELQGVYGPGCPGIRALSGYMKEVSLRFYAELNDLLSPPNSEEGHTHAFKAGGSVKDAIEALGVPHTEVDLILMNNGPAPFSYKVKPGDRISVFPAFRWLDLSSVIHLQTQAAQEIRFVLDTHLGKLASYLRMLGFDSLYHNDSQDEELAHISASQQRILLSRDRGLLKRSVVTHGYLVRETQPRQQLIEIVKRFDLSGFIAPFQLCVHCNAQLQSIAKELINDRLLLDTRRRYQEFRRCPDCDRIYWEGSHYQRMAKLIEHTIDSSAPSLRGRAERRVKSYASDLLL